MQKPICFKLQAYCMFSSTEAKTKGYLLLSLVDSSSGPFNINEKFSQVVL